MKDGLSRTCPACKQSAMKVFYEAQHAPVHSVMLFPTREEAVNFPQGSIALSFCDACGFISNRAFDASLQHYSTRCEETQGFSATFNAFHRKLAERMIDRYNLKGKSIIEIGCGKGEFLNMLCEIGNNHGVGFDPAYVPDRNVSPAKDRMTFIQDLYGEKYAGYQADFVCCKMTLEHIPDVADFMTTVRRSIGDRKDTVIFFQIPEVRRVLKDYGFWDVYYEHCSYFSQGSLGRLFRSTGFDVVDLATEYDDQYLMIEARPGMGTPRSPLPQESDLDALKSEVLAFSTQVPKTLERWKQRLRELRVAGKKAVLWGGGSKGVAFLTTLNIHDEVQYAVDINPYKKGTFMAGTGQEVVMPEFLATYRPDLVIVMNPIYMDEIRAEMAKFGAQSELLPITA
jgi:SAM-dependent methyltransferase